MKINPSDSSGFQQKSFVLSPAIALPLAQENCQYGIEYLDAGSTRRTICSSPVSDTQPSSQRLFSNQSEGPKSSIPSFINVYKTWCGRAQPELVVSCVGQRPASISVLQFIAWTGRHVRFSHTIASRLSTQIQHTNNNNNDNWFYLKLPLWALEEHHTIHMKKQ